MNKTTLLLLSCILLHACSSTDYDYGKDTKPVLNAIVTNCDKPMVQLTQSISIAENNALIYNINDATIHINENQANNTVFSHNFGGLYYSPLIPKQKSTIEISALLSDGNTIKGTAILPQTITWNNFTVNNTLIYQDTTIIFDDTVKLKFKDTMMYSHINFSFTDLLEKDNHYRIKVKKVIMMNNNEQSNPFKTLVRNYAPQLSPQLEWAAETSPKTVFVYTDKGNNGAKIEVNINLTHVFESNEKVKYYVYLENLSTSTIDYYNAYNDFYVSGQALGSDEMKLNLLDDDDTPTHIPFILENHIEGGYGFIDASAGSMDSVLFSKSDPSFIRS